MESSEELFVLEPEVVELEAVSLAFQVCMRDG